MIAGTQVKKPRPTGSIRILDFTGDTRLTWNKNNADEVQAAKEQVEKLIGKGFLLFSVEAKGAKGKKLDQFDPNVEAAILTPPIVGG